MNAMSNHLTTNIVELKFVHSNSPVPSSHLPTNLDIVYHTPCGRHYTVILHSQWVVLTHFPSTPLFQVETSNYEEAAEAASAGADVVMLDNFGADEMRAVARKLKEDYPHVLLEASGGITAKTFDSYLSDDVDVISQGSLTHGYKCLDFSLKVVAS